MHQPRVERQRLIWVINSACPSHCAYCGIESQRALTELDAREAVRAAQSVVEAGFREVVFVGGEPLVYRHLPAVLDELSGKCQVAVFSGGLPGDPGRYIEVLGRGVSRLVLSLDDADEDRNDLVRGRRGVSQELARLAEAVREHLPSVELSVSSVVTPTTVATLTSSWPRIRELEPTAWVAVLAGDNFVESPARHFLELSALAKLYLVDAPALARRIEREAPDTDFRLFPVPLPFLRLGLAVEHWDTALDDQQRPVRLELERYARGDYNASFVESFGCPLVGVDASIGVDGSVYACSQAPILRPEHGLGSVRDAPLDVILRSERAGAFASGVPHAACRRCWAPSNVAPSVLTALLAGSSGASSSTPGGGRA